jgi:hypothetical protein
MMMMMMMMMVVVVIGNSCSAPVKPRACLQGRREIWETVRKDKQYSSSLKMKYVSARRC